ncbi:MAG: hypothetical protein ACF8R9_02395 [Phycisphaerales bacterium JB054]
MSAVAVSQSVRSLFAAAMLAAIVLASAFAFVVATRLEETAAARLAESGTETAPADSVAVLVAMLVASVSLVGLLPALVTRAERFGLAVLGSSIGRMLLGMFAALILTQVGDAPSRPVWLGTVAGLGLILVIESILAIAVLSYLERLKSAGRDVAAVGVEPSQAC